ncbi:hypothetical protein C8J57DRAFT_1530371 [Mycena rebaudengoi]|nr:hypothetical protein C8J57DRAFT_1530371 [Mycena rebaudengoi]
MGVLRTPPPTTRPTRLGQANAKGYIYTELKAISLQISTEVALSNLKSTTPAANIDLAHISSRIRRLPYLAMENGFTIQPDVIHDCVVAIGAQRFLVSGHYSVEAPINGALKEVAPTFDWKGEIIVVQLGKKVNYLSKMQSPSAIAATNKFIASVLLHMNIKQAIPLFIS